MTWENYIYLKFILEGREALLAKVTEITQMSIRSHQNMRYASKVLFENIIQMGMIMI